MSNTHADLLSSLRNTFTSEGPAAALGMVIQHFKADGGTLHLLGEDGNLHLKANLPEMPPELLKIIGVIPVGKGMAGLAVQRGAPVQSCNIQTDDTGDVKPGAKKAGLQGSTCVPILDGQRAVGALGVGTVAEHTYTDEENELLMEMGRQFCD